MLVTRLRALATTLPYDLDSVSSTHMMVLNHLFLQFQGIQCPLKTHTCRENTQTHKLIIIIIIYNNKNGQSWWYAPLISALWAGERQISMGSRPAWSTR